MLDHKIKPGKEESKDMSSLRISKDEGLLCTVLNVLHTICLILIVTKIMSSHYYYFHFRDQENQSLERLSNLPKVMQVSRPELVQSDSGAMLLSRPPQES